MRRPRDNIHNIMREADRGMKAVTKMERNNKKVGLKSQKKKSSDPQTFILGLQTSF